LLQMGFEVSISPQSAVLPIVFPSPGSLICIPCLTWKG
jgi:hypothetical protein